MRESRLADEEGLGGGDLVPPSDEEEYELWLAGRERERAHGDKGASSERGASTVDEGRVDDGMELGYDLGEGFDLELAASPVS